MFLGVLNDEEKQAFTVLAERMIEVDGIVVGAETEALAALKREMAVDAAQEWAGRSTEALAAAFLGRRSRVAALLELIGLGYSDASFSVHEKSFVAKVATAMALGPEEIAELDQWVKDHVSHINRAMALMSG